MLGGADPVRVDRLHVPRVGLAAPAEQELLGGGLPAGDHLVGNRVGVAVGQARRAGDDRHHLRREPAEVVARLLVGDLVQLAELPGAREACRLGLEVGRRVPGERRRLVRLRLGHRRVEIVVDEQAPDALVRVVADELLDVDAPIAERAALAVRLGDLRFDGDDTLEARLELAHVRESTRTDRLGTWGRVRLRGPPSHPDPRRRDGPGADRGDAPRPGGDGRRVRLGRPARGNRRDGRVRRQSAARPRPRLDPGERRRAEGADHDPGRRRVPLGERRPPQEPRPVRAGAPVQELPGRPLAVRRPSTS